MTAEKQDHYIIRRLGGTGSTAVLLQILARSFSTLGTQRKHIFALQSNYSPFCIIFKGYFQKRTLSAWLTKSWLPGACWVNSNLSPHPVCIVWSLGFSYLAGFEIHKNSPISGPCESRIPAVFNTLLIHKKWTWQGDSKYGGKCMHVSVIKTDSVFWKSSSQQARIWWSL